MDRESNRSSGPPPAVRALRQARSLHGLLSLGILVMVVMSATTGILLGWKKHSDLLQPPTREARVVELGEWRPLAVLAGAATAALADSLGTRPADLPALDRLDVRPDRGMVKVRFDRDWEVQVEGATGRVLSVARRHSDWIERLHDGSILGDTFKVVAMTVLGFGLMVLAGSGAWMWYGPKRLRRTTRRRPRTGAGAG